MYIFTCFFIKVNLLLDIFSELSFFAWSKYLNKKKLLVIVDTNVSLVSIFECFLGGLDYH